jgi:exosome complex component RRP4
MDIMKLGKGDLVQFPPAKVPRLIGKKSSMLNLIKQHAGGDIIVGNNGYVWISEQSDIPLVLKAIDLVTERAHISGLTDTMEAFLKNEKEKTIR